MNEGISAAVKRQTVKHIAKVHEGKNHIIVVIATKNCFGN